MKTILKSLLCLLFLTILSSCAQEQIGNVLIISGRFAQINESGLTNIIVEFDDGQYVTWKSNESYPFAEKRIWHCASQNFHKTATSPYSIIDGVLFAGDANLGKIELADGVLSFNGETYGVLEAFNRSAYSHITVDPARIDLTYAAESVRVPVHIENPIPCGVLSATTTAEWIRDLRVEDGYLLFNTSSTKENRDAVIALSYTHADNLNLPVIQAPSTFIRFSDPDKTIGYEGSSQSIEYEIENPLASSVLTVNCSDTWIQDLEIRDGQVVFNVDDNNTGSERKACFYFQYEGAPDVVYTLTQKWDAATITTSPESAEFEYTGGQGNFTFEIQNPRQGASVTAQSQASWISNVAVSDNTVTYRVAENNSGAQRTGKIKLSYGNFTTMEFSIIQSWSAPSITLTPSSQTTEYQGGSFCFVYEIINPRENTTVTATSQRNWITDVKISGTTVCYTIAENNSNVQRTGTIKLKYGSYATSDFSTTQKGKPVVSLELNKNSLALNVGQSETLIATVDPSDAALTWSSDNTSVATVSQAGKVTAVGNGTATISVSTDNGKTANCVITVTTLVTSIRLNKASIPLYVGEEQTLIATVSPESASNKSLTWSSSDENVAAVDPNGTVTALSKGSTTIKAESQDGSGKYATCSVSVKNPCPVGAVDLGLSIYWATCNLGTSNPEEYGDHFAWGETSPKRKSDYSWDKYKWRNDSSTSSYLDFSLTKYNTDSSHGTVDNKIVLDPEDDAAHVMLGGNWRTPTDTEWTTLRSNCTWTWTFDYNGTGSRGYIVTSKNGKSIFLPAAGCYGVNNNWDFIGALGYYWSSSLRTDNSFTAWFVYFGSDEVGRYYSSRCHGFSVRPVTDY